MLCLNSDTNHVHVPCLLCVWGQCCVRGQCSHIRGSSLGLGVALDRHRPQEAAVEHFPECWGEPVRAQAKRACVLRAPGAPPLPFLPSHSASRCFWSFCTREIALWKAETVTGTYDYFFWPFLLDFPTLTDERHCFFLWLCFMPHIVSWFNQKVSLQTGLTSKGSFDCAHFTDEKMKLATTTQAVRAELQCEPRYTCSPRLGPFFPPGFLLTRWSLRWPLV